MSLKVSIITPIKNGEKYLTSCIESVLNQDYPDIKHIFADGLSTDTTLEILKHYQSKYLDRIIVHSAKDNGAGDAWNWGVTHAEDGILGWLGADDLLLPGAVSRVVAFFEEHPNSFYAYGEAEVIDKDGKYLTMYRTEPFDYGRLLNHSCYIVPTSAFYRKAVFDKCGLFGTFGSDYEMWLRIGKIYRMDYLKGDVLSQFRLHKEGSSSSTQDKTLTETYKASREHGGNLFNVWGRMYFLTKLGRISKPLKPVLGWSYPILSKILRLVSYYSPVFKKGEVNPLEKE